jgi:hypothetical protein
MNSITINTSYNKLSLVWKSNNSSKVWIVWIVLIVLRINS